jgi:hypothetical protein
MDSGPNGVTTTSSTISTVTSGHSSQALYFSGASNSHFQAAGFTAFSIDHHPFSISLWIQPQKMVGTLIHFSSSPLGTGPTCFPLIGFAANGAVVAQVLTDSGKVTSATGPVLPLSLAWIPIVQTWSAENGLKLYVNNTLVSSVDARTFLTAGVAPNYITLGNCLGGCSTCTNGHVSAPGPYTGAIDDWRVYIRELTREDVCTLYYHT